MQCYEVLRMMSELTDEMHELLEMVDAGLIGDDELLPILDSIDDPVVRRDLRLGLDLLRMLELLNPKTLEPKDHPPTIS